MKEKYKNLILLFVLFHISFVIYIVIKYSINMIYWDEWELVELISNKISLSFKILWQQHNEHRMFFPKLIIYILSKFTHWDVRYESYFSVFLFFLSTVVAYKILEESKFKLYPFVGIFILFILNLKQYMNYLWGFQIAWSLIFLAFLIVHLLISRGLSNVTDKIIFPVILVIASFSSMHGILVAIYSVIYSLKNIFLKKDIKFYSFLLFFSIGIILIYFLDWSKPIGHPDIFSFLKHPIDSIIFTGIFAGSIFSYSAKFAGLIGSGILVSFLFYLIRRMKEKSLLSIIMELLMNPLLFFGFGFMVMILIGRVGFGPGQANASRYSSFSAILNIGIFLFVFGNYSRDKFKKVFLYLYVIAIMIFYPFNIKYYYGESKKFYKKLFDARKCALNSFQFNNNTNKCNEKLLKVYPDLNLLKKRILYLHNTELSFFCDK